MMLPMHQRHQWHLVVEFYHTKLLIFLLTLASTVVTVTSWLTATWGQMKSLLRVTNTLVNILFVHGNRHTASRCLGGEQSPLRRVVSRNGRKAASSVLQCSLVFLSFILFAASFLFLLFLFLPLGHIWFGTLFIYSFFLCRFFFNRSSWLFRLCHPLCACIEFWYQTESKKEFFCRLQDGRYYINSKNGI